jgi:PAS domain-containing protein
MEGCEMHQKLLEGLRQGAFPHGVRDLTTMRSTSPDGLQLSTIVDGNPVATFVLNAEHVVTHWNQACEALTGVRARDVVGTKRQWAAFYAQERPVLADLVLSSKLEDLKKLYYSRCKQSGTVKGGIEAEDFFPDMANAGDGCHSRQRRWSIWRVTCVVPLRPCKTSVNNVLLKLHCKRTGIFWLKLWTEDQWPPL